MKGNIRNYGTLPHTQHFWRFRCVFSLFVNSVNAFQKITEYLIHILRFLRSIDVQLIVIEIFLSGTR